MTSPIKIASITPLYNAAQFVVPYFNQIDDFDVHIVLLSNEPFDDYAKVYNLSKEKDDTEELLKQFPKVKVFKHNFKQFGGELLNFGLEKARGLGADVAVKLDPDMFLIKEDWDKFYNFLKNDFPALPQNFITLDYRKCTTVYLKDFEHGVWGNHYLGLGNDVIALKTDIDFIEDGHAIKCEGMGYNIDWLMVHHFSLWKPSIDDEYIEKEKQKLNLDSWLVCPEEIQQKFNV